MAQRDFPPLDELRNSGFSTIVEIFAKSKPVIHIVCNPFNQRDVDVATSMANTFRDHGIEATTFTQFADEGGCEGDVASKMDEVVARTDIFIEVLSVEGMTKNNEGYHVAMMNAAHNDRKDVPGGKTRIFSVAATDIEADKVVRIDSSRYYGNQVGVWNEDPNVQKRLVLGMIYAGPQTRKADGNSL